MCALQNDEWVVCRVFQKFAGNKKLFLYADMPGSYQLTDAHSNLPGHHRDSSPNPTVTDDGDCEGNELCYNCQPDSFHDSVIPQGDVTWVQEPDSKIGNHDSNNNVAMATAAMDIGNLMKDSYYSNPNMMNNMGRYNPPPMTQPLTPVKAFSRMRATKVEPFYAATACDGEDEAQSSQRLNLDYAWPGGDSVLYQEFPCESPLTVAGDSGGQTTTSSCLTDGDEQHARVFNRMAMRGYLGLPEMSGPIDGLQELGWAY